MNEYVFKKFKSQILFDISAIGTLHYLEFDKNYAFTGEILDLWELAYIDKGEVIITEGTKEKRCKQGDILFLQPNIYHNIKADGVDSSIVFSIIFECKSKAMEEFKEKIIKLPKNLRPLVDEIINAGLKTFHIPIGIRYINEQRIELELKLLEEPLFGGSQLIKIYLEELLIKLLQNDRITQNKKQFFLSKKEQKHSIVSDALNILTDNIYGNLNINKICEKLSCSVPYLCKVFKDNTGHSIMKYYTMLKVTKAKELIKDGNYNFSQISDMLCFNNPHYFSWSFKNITGMTPREYKNSVHSFRNFE